MMMLLMMVYVSSHGGKMHPKGSEFGCICALLGDYSFPLNPKRKKKLQFQRKTPQSGCSVAVGIVKNNVPSLSLF